MGLVALLMSTTGLPYWTTTLQFNIAESFDPEDEDSLKCCCSDTAPIVISLKGAAVKVQTPESPSAPHASIPHCEKNHPTTDTETHEYKPMLQSAKWLYHRIQYSFVHQNMFSIVFYV